MTLMSHITHLLQINAFLPAIHSYTQPHQKIKLKYVGLHWHQ